MTRHRGPTSSHADGRPPAPESASEPPPLELMGGLSGAIVGYPGDEQPPTPHRRLLVGWAVLPDPENGWAGGLQPNRRTHHHRRSDALHDLPGRGRRPDAILRCGRTGRSGVARNDSVGFVLRRRLPPSSGPMLVAQAVSARQFCPWLPATDRYR